MEHEIFMNSLNIQATQDIKSTYPKYYELTPTIKHDDLFLIRSIYID